MQQVLRTLNHRRAARLLSNVHETFHAKEPCAQVLCDPVQKKLRLFAHQRCLAHENEILNTPAFEMVTVCVKSVIMLVMITFVRMIVAARDVTIGRILIGFRIEPRTGVRVRVGRVRTPEA